MVNVKVLRAFDVFNFNFSNILKAEDTSGTTSQFKVFYANGGTDIFSGTNLGYDAKGLINSGVITSYDFKLGGQTLYHMDGLEIQGSDIAKAAKTKSYSDDLAILYNIFSGDDTITGSKFSDRLDGFGGDDILKGNAGEDRLYGHAGDDKMSGGADSDTFKFFKKSGDDRITDFDAVGSDHDVLDLSSRNEIASLADLKANHISVEDGYLLITLSGGDSIRLDNVKLSNLGSTDFII